MSSSVFRWPDPESVTKALRDWAAREVLRHPALLRLGYFGSYARGDAGVGSDLDLVAVVARTDTPFMRRGTEWDLLPLPLPAEIFVYTREEWDRLQSEATPFARRLARETVWIWPEEAATSRR